MHVVPPYQPKLFLLHRDGTQYAFRDFDAAVADRQTLNGYTLHFEIGAGFDEVKHRFYAGRDENGRFRYDLVYYSWVLRDEDGRNIAPGTILAARGVKRDTSPRRQPGGKRGYGKSYRHPRTTQEIRVNAGWSAADGEPKPRAKRSRTHLPVVWDDCYRQCLKDRSWKRFRRQQWKA